MWYISLKNFVKNRLKGLIANIEKIFGKFHKLKDKIQKFTKGGKKGSKEDLKIKISSLILDNLIGWKFKHLKEDAFDLNFWLDKKEFSLLSYEFDIVS